MSLMLWAQIKLMHILGNALLIYQLNVVDSLKEIANLSLSVWTMFY